MALRRAGQSLAGRLLQGQVPAFSVAGVRAGPLLPQQEDDQSSCAVSASSMPVRGASINGALPGAACADADISGLTGCAHAGFASTTTDIATTSSGLPPTVHAIKNPSAAITYASLLERESAHSCRVAVLEDIDCVLVHCRYDERCHERYAVGDPSKRAFTYFVLTGGRFIYASALRLAVLKFILSMTVRLVCIHSPPHYGMLLLLTDVAD